MEGKLQNEDGGKLQNEARTFFFHFSEPLKFVLGLSTKMKIFYREKAFHAGK